MQATMAELVRVASLKGYLEVMGALGVDPRPLLKTHGLDRALLSNPEQFISAPAVIRLLEHSAQVTGCETIGLRMAEFRSLADLGATSLLIAHQPTLRDALATLTEYRARINSTLMLTLEELPGLVLLREEFSLKRPEPLRQTSDLALGVLARVCRAILGAGWRPQMVCFANAAPRPNDMVIYQRLFRCQPEFDREFTALGLSIEDLDRHNPGADVQLAIHARELLRAAIADDSLSTAQVVDQSVRLLLPTGKATIQNCAASMALTVRTLQRLLEAEGTSFSDILNATRMQLATEYLANSRMRVTDIAEILGYSSIGAFTRWHTQIFGKSPRDRRKATSRLL
jgi:AraC-like DNA-binding protein